MLDVLNHQECQASEAEVGRSHARIVNRFFTVIFEAVIHSNPEVGVGTDFQQAEPAKCHENPGLLVEEEATQVDDFGNDDGHHIR